MVGRAFLILLLLVAACDRLPRTRGGLLPSHLCVLVELEDGERVSLLLDLRHTLRDQLDVRVAEGARMYDGRHVWDLVETQSGGIDVADLVGATRAELPVEGAEEVVAIVRGNAWIRTAKGTLRCRLDAAQCAPTEVVPRLPVTHPGPGPGFRLSLEDGALVLALPQQEAGESIFTSVRRVVGIDWVRGGSSASEPVLNRTFRGRARINAPRRAAVVVDGDVSEWTGSAPLVVEDPWQLQYGARGWNGARDGSFSIAAAWTDEELCFAGRVRDDALGERDALDIHVNRRRVRVPLAASGSSGTWAVRPVWHGVVYEACVPGNLLPDGPLAFSAALEDADDGRPSTRLSTAQAQNGMPLGTLVRTREGPRGR